MQHWHSTDSRQPSWAAALLDGQALGMCALLKGLFSNSGSLGLAFWQAAHQNRKNLNQSRRILQPWSLIEIYAENVNALWEPLSRRR